MTKENARYESLIKRWDDEPEARRELIGMVYLTLCKRASTMLNLDFHALRNANLHQSQSVVHQAIIRFLRALEALGPAGRPGDLKSFIGLAVLQMRRTLLDLANEPRPKGTEGTGSVGMVDPGTTTYDPQVLAHWTELHDAVERLPENEKEAFSMIWYLEMPQSSVARVSGTNQKAVSRLWIAAKRKLAKYLF